jgi:hypothetical protein
MKQSEKSALAAFSNLLAFIMFIVMIAAGDMNPFLAFGLAIVARLTLLA